MLRFLLPVCCHFWVALLGVCVCVNITFFLYQWVCGFMHVHDSKPICMEMKWPVFLQKWALWLQVLWVLMVCCWSSDSVIRSNGNWTDFAFPLSFLHIFFLNSSRASFYCWIPPLRHIVSYGLSWPQRDKGTVEQDVVDKSKGTLALSMFGLW